MPREVIDDRFIGALHLRAVTHEGLMHESAETHRAIQTGTLNELMSGDYEGNTTIGDLLRLGADGIGTIQYLDGELIITEGKAFSARADGSILALTPDQKTPFAVVTLFEVDTEATIGECDYEQLLTQIDTLSPDCASIMAVRIHGLFRDLHLRSVHKQERPFKPLHEVVEDQTEWFIAEGEGTVVGFRFPDPIAGIEVPGWHLHFLSKDRKHGGHIMSLAVTSARVELDRCEDLHVELPSGHVLGQIGKADREMIRNIEGAN
jgi:acetolactate decarboxylase